MVAATYEEVAELLVSLGSSFLALDASPSLSPGVTSWRQSWRSHTPAAELTRGSWQPAGEVAQHAALLLAIRAVLAQLIHTSSRMSAVCVLEFVVCVAF